MSNTPQVEAIDGNVADDALTVYQGCSHLLDSPTGRTYYGIKILCTLNKKSRKINIFLPLIHIQTAARR